jgi:ApbE superfamily uncharacterized protein (UPF0280 family)
MMQAVRKPLSGQRWHFQHGPIDLVIGAEGELGAVAQAHERAWQRFQAVLTQLVAELPLLRQPLDLALPLEGAVAQRMRKACTPMAAHAQPFITPMAAVAGAVAEEIVACYELPGVRRAWVNNGGDIALFLRPGQSVQVGLYADLARLDAHQLEHGLLLDGQLSVHHRMPVRGVATSGWRGRSHSLGIADSVTVLAASATQADAAATVVANAVNLDDARILRRPACELRDDSDLGQTLVTVQVPPLPPEKVEQALQQGLQKAETLRAQGLIWFALLSCQQQVLCTGYADARKTLRQSPPALTLASPGSVIA